MIFKYVTDESVARMIPDSVELPDPPTAGLVFASYPSSNLGPVRRGRAISGRHLSWAADPVRRVSLRHERRGDGRRPRDGGVSQENCADRVSPWPGPARRSWSALPVCESAPARCARKNRQIPAPNPQQTAGPAPPLVLNYLTLRLIPSPQAGQPPSLLELLQTQWTVDCSEAWIGPGSCQFTGASELDPLHWAPVVKPIVCELIKGDIVCRPQRQPCETPL